MKWESSYQDRLYSRGQEHRCVLKFLPREKEMLFFPPYYIHALINGCHCSSFLLFPVWPFLNKSGKWASALHLSKGFLRKHHQHWPPSRLLVLQPLSKYGILPLVRMELVIYSKGYCGNLSHNCIPNQSDLFSCLYYTVTALLWVV